MGLETPIGAGVETSRGEGALNAEFILLGLHVVSNGLQLTKGVDVFDGLGLAPEVLKYLLRMSLL